MTISIADVRCMPSSDRLNRPITFGTSGNDHRANRMRRSQIAAFFGERFVMWR